jgi:hypothetical protein
VDLVEPDGFGKYRNDEGDRRNQNQHNPQRHEFFHSLSPYNDVMIWDALQKYHNENQKMKYQGGNQHGHHGA